MCSCTGYRTTSTSTQLAEHECPCHRAASTLCPALPAAGAGSSQTLRVGPRGPGTPASGPGLRRFQQPFHQYVAYQGPELQMDGGVPAAPATERQAVRIMKKLSEPLYWQGVPGVWFLGAPSAFSSNLGGTASSLEPSAAMFNSMQLPTTQR